MSYTYLLAQGEESSAASFSDIPVSVLSRLNLTAEKSSCNANATESCHDSLFGMMSEPSTANHGKDSLTLCAEGSPVRTSVQQEHESELTVIAAACGERCPESLAKYDPATHSW